jgi:hypothetical protein
MKAYELLDSPEKWTQGAMARNADGDVVAVTSPKAVRWCLAGAIKRSNGTEDWEKAYDAFFETNKRRGISWNDAPERTFEEVRAALIEADV